MEENVEKILIVHSVEGTSEDDLRAATATVQDFRLERPTGPIMVRAEQFPIPEAAGPLASLGQELRAVLDQVVGAIVFLDDLRPNVTYELGYIHGRGSDVLLVTRQPKEKMWGRVSDLAGCALAHLDRVDLDAAIRKYLTRLYDRTLPATDILQLWSLPRRERNLLNRLDLDQLNTVQGEYGATLVVDRYPEIDLTIGENIHPGARLHVLVRSNEEEKFFVYGRVVYSNAAGRRRKIWLGGTSSRRDLWITRFERLFPSSAVTREWKMLTMDFQDLLNRGFILGASSPDHLETVRFRAGARGRVPRCPIEVGFMGLSGIDR